MHLTLGILRTSQAVFYALPLFQLDGFAVPALVVEPVETQRRYPQGKPQTVGQAFEKIQIKKLSMDKDKILNSRLSMAMEFGKKLVTTNSISFGSSFSLFVFE